MQKAKLVAAIEKLAIAGEQAGLSVEQMISLLNQGMSVETLLDLVTWRLSEIPHPRTPPCYSVHWLM